MSNRRSSRDSQLMQATFNRHTAIFHVPNFITRLLQKLRIVRDDNRPTLEELDCFCK